MWHSQFSALKDILLRVKNNIHATRKDVAARASGDLGPFGISRIVKITTVKDTK